MRGDDQQQDGMFSYISPDKRVPQDHPLRMIRSLVDGVLEQLSPRFNKLYARAGRPSIAPEKLLRALLLQMLYSVRSERLLMEQLDYNLLFRWFVGLSMDDEVWDASTFSKNRERLLEGDIAEAFFQGVLGEARAGELLSDEHFTVDGTLLEAWASHKSFRPVDGVAKDKKDKKDKKDDEPKPPAPRWDENNPTINYRGEKRSNQTHCSTTDPEAMLARKGPGKEAKLSYHGHLMTENRSGLVVNTLVTTAYGAAECHAGLLMAEKLPGRGRVTLGADKGYDQREFIDELRQMEITPHVAQNQSRRRSRVDRRTTRHCGYEISQRKRKRIEEVFGWMKTVGLLRKLRRGKLPQKGKAHAGMPDYNSGPARSVTGSTE
jgi:transposase